jgi:hypothetical protein
MCIPTSWNHPPSNINGLPHFAIYIFQFFILLAVVRSDLPMDSVGKRVKDSIGIAPQTNTSTAAPPKDNSFMAYTIAVITFGAAIGNMFLAGRLRKMNLKMPQGSKIHEKHQGSRSSSSASANNSSNTASSIPLLPPDIVYHLSCLGLPGTRKVKSEDIKIAYRAAAMKYHPDRLDESSRTPKNAEKFKRINAAHEKLKAYFKL